MYQLKETTTGPPLTRCYLVTGPFAAQQRHQTKHVKRRVFLCCCSYSLLSPAMVYWQHQATMIWLPKLRYAKKITLCKKKVLVWLKITHTSQLKMSITLSITLLYRSEKSQAKTTVPFYICTSNKPHCLAQNLWISGTKTVVLDEGPHHCPSLLLAFIYLVVLCFEQNRGGLTICA